MLVSWVVYKGELRMATERKIIVSVSLSQIAMDKLDTISYKECKSRSEVIREAVDKYLEEKQ